MKSYEEMTESILKRREEYFKKRMKIKKTIMCVSTCFCISLACGFLVFHNVSAFSENPTRISKCTEFSDISVSAEIITYTTTAPETLIESATEFTETPSVTSVVSCEELTEITSVSEINEYIIVTDVAD